MATVLRAVGDPSLRIKNVAASAAIVVLACAVYAVAPFHQDLMQRLYRLPGLEFTGLQSLIALAGAYILVLAAYLLTESDPGVSKSLRFFRVLASTLRAPVATIRAGLSPEDRLAVLTTLLKSFFGPLMVIAMVDLCGGAWAYGTALVEAGLPEAGIRPLFDRYVFWFLLKVVYFVDVLIFTVGYLVESRKLGNEIRSVDPTLVGWAAALACYTPFNALTGAVLGSPTEDFPHFDNTTIHITLNVVALSLLTVYTSASVALGLKASNLTHRGVVARGPYAVIRHPAYTCKNMAWWIGSVPFVLAAFDRSWFEGVQAVGSIAGWSAIYILRALTEEDHLRSVDGEYAAYAAKVRYRFIPGVV